MKISTLKMGFPRAFPCLVEGSTYLKIGGPVICQLKKRINIKGTRAQNFRLESTRLKHNVMLIIWQLVFKIV